MKLITDGVWSLSRTHLRILRSAEECMKSYAVIPFDVLKTRSRIPGNFMKHAVDLCKLKFLSYIENGYKLTCSGHDCLAINTLRLRGLEAMGERIGIGKESDIYFGVYGGKESILKFHRLGRTSFRSVRRNRGYTSEKTEWLALSRISCRREVMYLERFKDMSVPVVLDHDRHVIVQELLDYLPLYKTRVANAGEVFGLMLSFIRDLWNRGYVHGDFNEFNVLVRDGIKVIDFPQCIKRTDDRALHYLKRDIDSVLSYFKKKYGYEPEEGFCAEFMDSLGAEGIDEEPSQSMSVEDFSSWSEDKGSIETEALGAKGESLSILDKRST